MEICYECTHKIDSTNIGCIYDDFVVCKDCWPCGCQLCYNELPIIDGSYNIKIGSKNRPYCPDCMCNICGLYAWNEDSGITDPLTNKTIDFFMCCECDKYICIWCAATTTCQSEYCTCKNCYNYTCEEHNCHNLMILDEYPLVSDGDPSSYCGMCYE